MFGAEILEVAIGIIFVFFLVSVLCSAVREGIEALLKTRSAYLEHGIRELLHDRDGTGLATSFYNHPLIYGLYLHDYEPRPTIADRRGKRPWWRVWSRSRRPPVLARGSGLPTYIPARSFALALMDMAARGRQTDALSGGPDAPPLSLDSIRQNVAALQNPAIQRVLLAAIDAGQNDLNRVVKNLEDWYDSGMDRVSGWYKRASQWVIFFVGIAVAVLMNINAVALADYLYRNDVAREALVARAEAAARDTTLVARATDDYQVALGELDALKLPIGWSRPDARHPEGSTFPGFLGFWALAVVGWIVTGIAATLGAPFWFDVLNKVMVIRSTVKPKEKSPPEASEDRQRPRPDVVVTETAAPTVPAATPPPATGGTGGGGGTGGAAQPPPGTAPPPHVAPPDTFADPGDAEAEVDACDVEVDEVTPDEDLPPARGGVAR